MTTPHPRTVVSYVRRSPRMTPSQRGWLDKYAGCWVLDVGPTTEVEPQPPLDLAEIFGRQAPLIVEIGSGHGDTLVTAAAKHPDTDFIGFEVFDASVAITLGKIASHQVDNVRLVAADAVSGLAHLFAPQSVAEIWVFFPDPWPKKRHHKRRLVSPSFADLVARTLVPGGVIRLATDWDSYAAVMAEVFGTDDRFESAGTDRFATRPVTKFEARGLEAGRVVHDFAYRVRPS